MSRSRAVKILKITSAIWLAVYFSVAFVMADLGWMSGVFEWERFGRFMFLYLIFFPPMVAYIMLGPPNRD